LGEFVSNASQHEFFSAIVSLTGSRDTDLDCLANRVISSDKFMADNPAAKLNQ
jgi:hypothetical protein